MNHAWTLYKKALFEKLPSMEETLNPGASEAELQAAETELGIAFPAALRSLYLTNNGDNHESANGMILGFPFYSLEELRSAWRGWVDLANDPAHNSADHFSSSPAGCIKRRYADTKWIPLCDDGGGNYIGIDLDPDVNGKAGQIINFGRDEHNKVVLAENLDAFFARLTRIIQSDDFGIEEDEEDIIVFGPEEHRGHYHLTDYLKSDDSVK